MNFASYFRTLWAALKPGNVVLVSPSFIKEHMGMIQQLDEQAARIAKYERRAAGQRKANEARKAAAAARAADTPF